jgi:hypothetical protein
MSFEDSVFKRQEMVRRFSELKNDSFDKLDRNYNRKRGLIFGFFLVLSYSLILDFSLLSQWFLWLSYCYSSFSFLLFALSRGFLTCLRKGSCSRSSKTKADDPKFGVYITLTYAYIYNEALGGGCLYCGPDFLGRNPTLLIELNCALDAL